MKNKFALLFLIVLSMLNLAFFIFRLIFKGNSLFFPELSGEKPIDFPRFLDRFLSASLNQALLEHSFYQLVIIGFFILIPIALLRAQKFSIGSFTFEGMITKGNTFKNVTISAGAIKYLAQFNSEHSFKVETNKAARSQDFEEYLHDVFSHAIEEVYEEAKIEMSHAVFNSKMKLLTNRDVRIELKNKREIAESGHVVDVKNDEYDYRTGYKNQLLVYVRSLVDTESPSLYIVVSAPLKDLDQHDNHFFQGTS